jgi:hypothetical protein
MAATMASAVASPPPPPMQMQYPSGIQAQMYQECPRNLFLKNKC